MAITARPGDIPRPPKPDTFRVETLWGPGRTWYLDRLGEGDENDRGLTSDQAHARADAYRARGYSARILLETA